MTLDNLIAICGPNCTQCQAYMATRSGNPADLERVAGEWTRFFGKAFTADDIICDGCRVEGGRLSAYCASCDIRQCAVEKGHMTCAHCPDCPCERIVAPPAREALAAIRKVINACQGEAQANGK